jgi:hypothetical protein
MRIVVISRYLQLVHKEKREEDNAEYEAFVSQATGMDRVRFREIITEWWPRKEPKLISAYGFFAWAQYLSTFLFAIGVVLFGLSLNLTPWEKRWLLLSAIISLSGLAWMYIAYKRRFLGVQNLEELGKVKKPRQ